jgi:hypothetical protein
MSPSQALPLRQAAWAQARSQREAIHEPDFRSAQRSAASV